MSLLEELRAANPDLPLHSVEDPCFAPYGRILKLAEGGALLKALHETPVPESGNAYLASCEALEACAAVRTLQERTFGGMPVEAGYCNGRGSSLNALEYHKCSEINASDGGLVLLLARPDDLRDGTVESRDIVGFYLPPHVFVEIYPRVLHFAPCRISEEGFRCLVVLEKGTNDALPALPKDAEGEDKLLWMRNKWLICHPDSPQAAKGAWQGIRGRNWQLELPVRTQEG